jgi:hypothetical protein
LRFATNMELASMIKISSSAEARADTPVFWGDKFALNIWLTGCVVLWVLALANLLSNLWPR